MPPRYLRQNEHEYGIHAATSVLRFTGPSPSLPHSRSLFSGPRGKEEPLEKRRGNSAVVRGSDTHLRAVRALAGWLRLPSLSATLALGSARRGHTNHHNLPFLCREAIIVTFISTGRV